MTPVIVCRHAASVEKDKTLHTDGASRSRIMSEAFSGLLLVLLVSSVGLLIIVLVRMPRGQKVNEFREELRAGREEANRAARDSREELSKNLNDANQTLSGTLANIAEVQRTQLQGITARIQQLEVTNEQQIYQVRRTLDERLERNGQELADGWTAASDKLSMTLNDLWQVQHIQLNGMNEQLKTYADTNQQSLEGIRQTLDCRVKELQDSNEKKLDDMRKTVDEKLHATLQDRLKASFGMVSERLEAVHRGLGEMQNLATGVGDLQRVLTNVKVRGTWAEVQLGALLDQILAPSQYEKNVRVKADSNESVEYAVRLPGKKEDPAGCLWLPIDSKFPQEDYRRLQDAADRADAQATRKASTDLLRTIRKAAEEIHAKYINPPTTTDFAVMFLATEGLYGEALRHPTLVEHLQRRYRVVISGPSTLIALLNSLRMGFQTLAIEQRASEAARVLGAVKTEFGKFNKMLEDLRRQLNTATRTIEESGFRRTRVIERKLESIEQLSDTEAATILQIPEADLAIELQTYE
jgi:DNA recombination protein RmuC